MRAFISLCLFTAALWGQSSANKGEITGTVFDQNQAVVPAAKVEIKNQATGFMRELTTSEVGQFRAVLLDPGAYTVTVDKAGFAKATFEGVVVTVGANVDLPVTLQVGATVESIVVGETLIRISAPAPQATLNTNAITNLPINGRRFHDFAVLTPTVQVDPQRGQLSFAGQRGINANVMLDGSDYNQPFFGGIRGGERSNSVFTVPQGAIQEFQVVTTGYSAEYGRSSGGVLNAITKSGANELHGDAFYQVRHKETGLKNPVQNIASLETLQQFGGSAGGPVRRDKLFFFGAIERQESRTPRQVYFSQIASLASTANTKEAYDFFKSEEKPFSQTNDATAATARTDYSFPAGHRLTLRYNFSDANAANAVSVGGALSPFTNRTTSNDGTEKDRTHTGTVQHTHLFSPNVLNDFRFGGTFEERPRLSNSALPQTSGIVGTFGARNYLPTTQDDLRLQFTDGLSVTRGRHTMKIGFDYNYVKAAQVFGFNQFGAFSISGSNVNTFLDILSAGGSIPNRFGDRSVTYQRQIGNMTASFNMHQVAAFAQDNWRVSPKLTIDYGLRWEGQYNPSPEANNNSVIDKIKGFRFPNGLTTDPTVIRDSLSQVMPRFGFAWTPVGATGGERRLVVRGHTGIFYASTPLLLFAGPTNNFRVPPGDVSISLNPTATQTVYEQLLAVGIDLNSTPLGSLPVISIEKVQEASAKALGQARDPYAGIGVIGAASDYQNPRAFQAGLGADTEVFRNFVLGAQFNYVNTVHLERNRDYNLPAPVIRPTDRSQRPFYGQRSGVPRPIPSLAAITIRETSARSMYRGMTLSGQYRTPKFQAGVFYTLAETFSDDDTERDSGGFNYADPSNFRADYGYSRLDIRHQASAYAVYSMPWGFEVSAILGYRSGVPINPTTGADTNEELASNDRPFSAPGVPLERNSFRNRSIVKNDLRVLKNFRFGERVRLQFSAEFFNLFNVDNVVYAGSNGGIFGAVYGLGIDANGNSVPVDPRFMRLRMPDGRYDTTNEQAGTPFQAQFGLRLFF